VDGVYYPSQTAAMSELSGRQISVGPATMSGLEVTRKFFVPTSEAYCRILEILVNPTASPIAADVEVHTNPGSDSSTNVFGSSSGDLIFDTADDWVCTDDSSPAGGDPSLIHCLGGDLSPTQPVTVGMVVHSCATTDGIAFTYNVTVPAGGRAVVMHFCSQNASQTVATPRAPTFSALTIPDALQGISAGLQADIVNF
jgi:hypothetical protein